MIRYFVLLLIFLSSIILSQNQNSDIPLTTEQIRSANIRNIKISRIIHKTGSAVPKFLNTHDQWGRLTEQTKYHIIDAMTVKEKYVYNNDNKISEKLRYNSDGGLILHIKYKYGKNGALRSERYTTYANTVYRSLHYMINADISRDSVFAKIQQIAGIEPPIHTYTLTVNINDEDEFNRYIVIGDEKDPSSQRIPWSELSPDIQMAIINYDNNEKKTITDRSVFVERVLYKSDDKGRIVSKRTRTTSQETLSSESYSYDEKGNLLNINYYSSTGSLKNSMSYKYDTTGNVMEIISASGKTVNNYDSTLRLAGRNIYNTNGELITIEVYVYNESGKISEIIQSDADNKLLSRKVFEYNEQLNPASYTLYNSENEGVETINYIYNYN